MDGEQYQQLVTLRQTYLRRLWELEKQVAATGVAARPEVLTEIADIRAHIEKLDRQLGPTAPRSLRDPVPDFVGRRHEIEQIINVLEPIIAAGAVPAVCGIRGLGGVGKTELAYMVAQRLSTFFSDGQVLIELHHTETSVLTPVEAIQTVIRTFDRASQLPDNLTELQGIYRAVLTRRRVLILADDAINATQIRPLVPPAGCVLLVTSRHRFTLPGMLTLDLGMLPPEDAAALLLSICPRLGSNVHRLAALCGYLPVALRISASVLANDDTLRINLYLEQLADLRAKLALLRDPDDAALNVEASLGLSYNELGTYVQDVLCQLSVFPISFDTAAVEVVVKLDTGSTSDTIQDALSLLRRRSFIEWDEITARYSLHDLVRAFAATRLARAEEVEFRHARYYAQVVEHIGTLYRFGSGNHQQDALVLFDQERGHIDAGWAWARAHAGTSDADQLLLDYATATKYVGDLRYDPRRERIPQYEAMLDAARRLAQPQAELSALIVLGGAYRYIGETDQAIRLHTSALERSRQISDPRGEEEALGNLGSDYYTIGAVGQSIDLYEQRLAIARSLGDRRVESYTLHDLGIAYTDLDARQANSFYEQALVVAQQSNDAYMQEIILRQIGTTYDETLGNPQEALPYYEKQLAIAKALGNRREESRALGGLGKAYASLGDAHTALIYYQQRLEIVQALGDRRTEGYTLGNMGRAYGILGDKQSALDYCLKALAIAESIGNQRGTSYALGDLGRVHATLGELQPAIDYYEQALVLAQRIGNRRIEAHISKSLSSLMEKQGDLARAIALLQVSIDYEHVIAHRDAARDSVRLTQMRLQLKNDPPKSQS